MAYDGWIEFDGVEIVNLSRTAQLAQVLGITSVWTQPDQVAWIETALGASDYDDIATAPWYDLSYPASQEFAGIVPLGFPGLGDSTLTSVVTEYLTDGGRPSPPRHTALSIVGSVAIVASTDRGAEYGKRWLDQRLRGDSLGCGGAELRYFRWASEDSPKAHHREVRTTRGTSITRKVSNDCSVSWLATFTLTAGDPFEYGEPVEVVTNLGAFIPGGPLLLESGEENLEEAVCPTPNYMPIYDPMYPALVPGPATPNLYPEGWQIIPGATFHRYWAKTAPVTPVELNSVPLVTISTGVDAVRWVRVSIWPYDTDPEEQCEALFVAILSYIPALTEAVIDSERQVAYINSGTDLGRRCDSLLYGGSDARPISWDSINASSGLLVAFDLLDGFASSGLASVSLVQKSN